MKTKAISTLLLAGATVLLIGCNQNNPPPGTAGAPAAAVPVPVQFPSPHPARRAHRAPLAHRDLLEPKAHLAPRLPRRLRKIAAFQQGLLILLERVRIYGRDQRVFFAQGYMRSMDSDFRRVLVALAVVFALTGCNRNQQAPTPAPAQAPAPA